MKRVILVGNCHFDGSRIASLIESTFENTTVARIDTTKQARTILKKDGCKVDLIIINRIGNFDKKNGLGLIDHVQKNCKNVPIMLITNYEDKMKEAMEHSAVQGFGKANLETKKTIALLSKYLR